MNKIEKRTDFAILIFLAISAIVLYVMNISNVISLSTFVVILLIILAGLLDLIFNKKTKKSYIPFLAIAVSFYLIMVNFIIFLSVVDGSSMYPTLKDNQRVFISVFNYKSKNDDVVAYELEPDFFIVKRVAAIKGDTIGMLEEKDGNDNKVYYLTVNGNKYVSIYNEYYQVVITDKIYQVIANKEYQLKTNEILLLGDNTKYSKDGRQYGLLSKDKVLGRVIGNYGKE